MSLALSDRTIERVCLVDDKEEVRAMYRYHVEDLSLTPNEVTGPIQSFEALISTFDAKRDAVISDFQLTSANYARQTGDWLVSRLYQKQIPAVLCTRWSGSGLPEEVRFRRRQIPVVLSPTDLHPDSIRSAFNLCTEEFSGRFSKVRKPWRALIRIEGAEANGSSHFRLAIVVPSWDPNIGLSYLVPNDAGEVLQRIAQRVSKGEIVRAFGQVNLGADSDIDVYIDEWTLAE